MTVPQEAAPVVENVDRMVRSALASYEHVVETAVEWLEEAGVSPWTEGRLVDEARSLVDAAVARQVAEEASWGEAETDVDRLLAAFRSLEADGVAVFEDMGPDVRGGHLEAREAILHERDAAAVLGYVFSCQQDIEAAVDEGVLLLSWGGWGFHRGSVVRIALLGALQEQGFEVEDPGEDGRVAVHLEWQRRGWASGELGPTEPPDRAGEGDRIEEPALGVLPGMPVFLGAALELPVVLDEASRPLAESIRGGRVIVHRAEPRPGQVAIEGELFAVNRRPDGVWVAVILDTRRVRLIVRTGTGWLAEVLPSATTSARSAGMARRVVEAVRSRAESGAALHVRLEMLLSALSDKPPAVVADIVGAAFVTDPQRRVRLLQSLDADERLELVLDALRGR